VQTKAHDGNDDGFVDIPQVEQYNLWNRWAYMGDHYVLFGIDSYFIKITRLHIRMMCLPASATFGKGLEACLRRG